MFCLPDTQPGGRRPRACSLLPRQAARSAALPPCAPSSCAEGRGRLQGAGHVFNPLPFSAGARWSSGNVPKGEAFGRGGTPEGSRRGAGSAVRQWGAGQDSAPRGEVTKPDPLVSPGVPHLVVLGRGLFCFPVVEFSAAYSWRRGCTSPLRNPGSFFPRRTRRLQVYGAQQPSSAARAELPGEGCSFWQD